jgi:hypothetical protein
MNIADLPPVINISHDVFYTIESQINMRRVMHCKTHTTNNHNDLILSLKGSEIPKVIKVNRCGRVYYIFVNQP